MYKRVVSSNSCIALHTHVSCRPFFKVEPPPPRGGLAVHFGAGQRPENYYFWVLFLGDFF